MPVSSHVSPFGVAYSFASAYLKGTVINLLLRRASESKDLIEKEKGALYKSTYIICGTAGQLSKNLTISGAISMVVADAASDERCRGTYLERYIHKYLKSRRHCGDVQTAH